jgi:hypothetical protein
MERVNQIRKEKGFEIRRFFFFLLCLNKSKIRCLPAAIFKGGGGGGVQRGVESMKKANCKMTRLKKKKKKNRKKKKKKEIKDRN